MVAAAYSETSSWIAPLGLSTPASVWAERGGNTEHLCVLHWGMLGRPGRDSGPPGIVETEVGKGNRGSVGWREGNIHRIKAKKPGISFQLFLVVALAFLQRRGDAEPLNLLRLPITPPHQHIGAQASLPSSCL